MRWRICGDGGRNLSVEVELLRSWHLDRGKTGLHFGAPLERTCDVCLRGYQLLHSRLVAWGVDSWGTSWSGVLCEEVLLLRDVASCSTVRTPSCFWLLHLLNASESGVVCWKLKMLPRILLVSPTHQYFLRNVWYSDGLKENTTQVCFLRPHHVSRSEVEITLFLQPHHLPIPELNFGIAGLGGLCTGSSSSTACGKSKTATWCASDGCLWATWCFEMFLATEFPWIPIAHRAAGSSVVHSHGRNRCGLCELQSESCRSVSRTNHQVLKWVGTHPAQ